MKKEEFKKLSKKIIKLSTKLKLLLRWKVYNPIKYLLCNHKYIDVIGGGFANGNVFTTFWCVKCHKNFTYKNVDLTNETTIK